MHTDNGIQDETTQPVSGAGLTPSCYPNSQSMSLGILGDLDEWVSTNYAPSKNDALCRKGNLPPPHWFALRATYGREKAACDYLTARGITAFCPMQKTAKIVDGKRCFVLQSRLPNIFFALSTEAELEPYVYDNVNLPFLRFYYRHYHDGADRQREPLIVPDRQMETFRIICCADEGDTFITPDEIHLFERGELVRVTQGRFTGVTGRIAQFRGQKRVGIYIDGIATVATAYIPKTFLEKIEE